MLIKESLDIVFNEFFEKYTSIIVILEDTFSIGSVDGIDYYLNNQGFFCKDEYGIEYTFQEMSDIIKCQLILLLPDLEIELDRFKWD